MSNRGKKKFTIKFNDRKGYFHRITQQPYQNCEISAGIITGLEPDTLYLRFDRDKEKPTTIFLRPDEASAMINVLSGAMWSEMIVKIKELK